MNTRTIEEKVDEILLDYCTNPKCSDLQTHTALKGVVRDRVLKLIRNERKRAVEEINKRIESIKIEGNIIGNFQLGEKILAFVKEVLEDFKNQAKNSPNNI